MAKKIIFVIMALSFYAFSAPANTGDAAAAQEKKAVAVGEGFALGGINGLISRDAKTGEFFFHPEERLTDNVGSVEKDAPVMIIECSGLEVIKAVFKEDAPLRLKVWGLFTVYDKTNYAYINYVLPVMISEQPAVKDDVPPVGIKPGEVIPENVLERLRSGGRIDNEKIDAFESQKKDGIYADRTGFIQMDKAGKYIFVPDGLGQNIETEKLYLIKCQTLETIKSVVPREFLKIRYKVAGIVNEFQGEKYLLLQRSARTYGYGNLSEF